VTDSEWKVVQTPAEDVPPETLATEPPPEVVEGDFKLTDEADSQPPQP
jgi:hypothetical protein